MKKYVALLLAGAMTVSSSNIAWAEPTDTTAQQNDTMDTVVSASAVQQADNPMLLAAKAEEKVTNEGIVGGSIKYTVDETGNATVTGFTGSIVRANIPANPEPGVTITAIGDSAFVGSRSASASNLLSVTLPDTVTTIGKKAFAGGGSYGHQIVDMALPKSITSIGDNAFQNCAQLKTIDMRGITLESMGAGVFSGCPYLTGVVIDNNTSCFYLPDGISEIPKNTFSGCERLQNVDNLDSIATIGENAFSGCIFLDKINIPKSVWRIGKSAFNGCSKMVSVEGCEGVSSIGDTAFKGCIALVNIPNENFKNHLSDATVKVDDKDTPGLGAGIFSGCTSLRYVELPLHISAIPDDTFSGCTALIDPIFPDNIQTIGDNAFSGCVNFTSVVLNHEITDIGVSAFEKCTGIKEVNIDADFLQLINSKAFNGCSKLSKVTIKSLMPMAIGDYTFAGNSTLTDVSIDALIRKAPLKENSDVITFGEGIFENDSALVNIQWPDSITDAVYGVTELPANTYSGCISLEWDENKLLAPSIVSIGSSAFKKCAFKTIKLPDRVITIGKNAFDSCADATAVDIGNGVSLIDESAFNGCSAMESIKLSDVLEVVNKGVFNNCTSLQSVVVPESVTYMGDAIWKGCSALTSVTLPSSLEAVTQNMFYDCSSLENIDLSKTKVTSIKSYGFGKCTNLKSIKWPDVITSIDKLAFQDCTSLMALTLPRSLLTIGDSAFRGCTNITQFNLNEGLMVMGNTVFENCSSLKTMFIPVSTAAIGNKIFNNCTSLTTLIVPKSVVTIGTSIIPKSDNEITIYTEEDAAITHYDFGTVPVNFVYSMEIPDTLEGWLFDLQQYSKNNPEIAECFANKPAYMYLHWVNFGIYDDKVDMQFDDKAVSTGSYIFNSAEYAKYNPDVAELCGNDPSKLLEHYIVTGCNSYLTASKHFSGKTYKLLHPTLTGAEQVKMYLANGMKENADPGILGDVNDDGVVDSKDTVRLMRYIAGMPETINEANADTNEDDAVNSKDTVRLMRAIAEIAPLH